MAWKKWFGAGCLVLAGLSSGSVGALALSAPAQASGTEHCLVVPNSRTELCVDVWNNSARNTVDVGALLGTDPDVYSSAGAEVECGGGGFGGELYLFGPGAPVWVPLSLC